MADIGRENAEKTGLEIAVISVVGRFPGAKNIHEFWDNLKNGVGSVSFFSDQELVEAGVDPALINNPAYVKAKGVLEDVEYFDSALFDYTPAEAKILDPQVRVFHECVWEALENAGYDPKNYNGKIGIYAGASSNFYWQAYSMLSGVGNSLDPLSVFLLTNKDFLTTRISFKFNLRGPSFSVQTACSTSLVAIHLACQGLLSGECSMALAGGVTISFPLKSGYVYREGMTLSPDGFCRAFDAEGSGFVGGDGVGVVLLKMLEDAIADGDYIHAVIKGSAINNDGNQKAGFTAPSIKAQTGVINAALSMAEVEPESIGYVETHGTGTPLGDPIEIEALKRAFNFNTKKKNFCKIGSVKTNVGHLDSAAGIAGFIKTVLALKHRQIPPSLYFKAPNPKIDFENSPFTVNTQLSPWENGKNPLRAGVTSLGMGGTNAHVILEEWSDVRSSCPGRPAQGTVREDRKYKLIVLSAGTETALEKMTENLASYLKKHPGINLADVAYTLQLGRGALKHRRMLVCSSSDEAVEALADLSDIPQYKVVDDKNRVVFMFAGLGSQYVNMGLDLYRTEPIFQQEINRCFEILKPLLGYDIKDIFYPSANCHLNMSPNINQIEIAQLVVFILEYALAKLLMKWGITPHAMIGYSFGEYTAACLSGVFSLDDALKIIVYRGKLLARVTGGTMLSVPLSSRELNPLLDKELSIAINNGSSCIVAGPKAAVASFEKEMKKKRVMCMAVPHSVAMHSKMMETILDEFEELLGRIKLYKPQIPYISNVTGKWINVQEAADPAYWSRHLRETVQFADGINQLIKEPNIIFIEIGPGRDLSTLLVRYREENSEQRAVNLIRQEQQDAPDDRYLLHKIGKLWLYGVKIDWQQFYCSEKRYRIPLPTYSFDRQRYLIDGDLFKIGTEILSKTSSLGKKTDMPYCYIPSWKPSAVPIGEFKKNSNDSWWLIFIDESDFSSQLVGQIKKRGEKVVCVKIGNKFKREKGSLYTINPKKADNYDILFSNLPGLDKIPVKIVHLWNLTEKIDNQLEFDKVEQAQALGFYSLLNIVRAIGRQDCTNKNEFQIKVVTNNMQNVIGDAVSCVEKVTVLAPLKIIPLEYPHITCSSIDILLPGPGTWQETRLKDQLLVELKQDSSDLVIAYRGNDRLVRAYEPVSLTKPGDEPVRLRQNGVYLITEGLDGDGFKMAEHLAQILKPKLVFIENTTVLQKTEWENIENPEIENKIKIDVNKEIDFLTEVEEKNEKALGIKGIESYQGLEETINKLCSSLILSYFKSNYLKVEPGEIYSIKDLKKRLKILPKFNKFYDFFIKVLSEDKIIKIEDNKIEFLKANDEFKDSLKLLKQAEKKYPQFMGTLRLIKYCASNYSTALSGEIEAISVLFPEGNNVRFKEEYRDSAAYSYQRLYLLVLQEFISEVLEKLQPKSTFRILEVGAGAGNLTRVLVPSLINKNVEYHFTDIGNFFVINAQKEASKQEYTFMKFGTFDISKDPLKQGYEPYSFDMVLGYNVVHTTRSIEESIGNLKQLLVPGGMMCLIESTNPKRWLNMIDGLAEGWWYFEDEGIRKNSPLLSLDDWEKVLKKQGFQGVNSFPQDKKNRSVTDCGLIVAQQEREINPGGWYSKIHEDETQQIKNKIRNLKKLEKFGAEVLVINADVANLQQMKKAISQAKKRFGKINGVIHFTEVPDYESEIQESSLEMIDRILVSKVKGTLVLEKIFNNRSLDFFALCSSLDSIISSPGKIGRCAANTFLDYFAHYKLSRDGRFIVSINWDSNLEASLMEIGPAAIGSLLGRILNHSFPQVVISGKNLTNLLEQTNEYKYHQSAIQDSFTQESLEKVKPAQPKYQRSELSSKYAAPRDEIEQTLTGIWEEYLGIEQVGILDNFFELGADSLVFITIAARIHRRLHVSIPPEVFFRNPNIEELAGYIIDTGKDIYSSIKPVEKKEHYALSSAQKRLYFLHLLETGKKGYNGVHVMKLEGEFEKNRITAAFRKLIQRHESLRTSFYMWADKPIQKIHDAVEFEVQWLSLPDETGGPAKPGGERKDEVESIINDFVRPFDLAKAPLMRVGLIKERKISHILVVVMHHIINDGVSESLLMNEFMTSYAERVLPPLRLQYKDYSQWQQTREVKETLKQQQEYWLQQFEGEIPILNLLNDFPRPPVQSFEGSTINFELSTEETKALNEMALSEGATLFMVLLTIYNIFLSKLSSLEDIIVGIPIAGRNHADLELIIGMFVNTLVLRNFPSGEKTFEQFLRHVRENSLKAFENQNYPFEELVNKVEVERDVGRNPLFDVMLALQNMFEESTSDGTIEEEILGWKTEPYPYEGHTSTFDLSLIAVEVEEKLHLKFEYCTRLFKKETIVRFIKYFKKIISNSIESPGKRISEIEIISEEEKNQILFDFNNTEKEYPGDKVIHRLFEEQVERIPDHIAIVGSRQLAVGKEENIHLTYRKLNRQANQLTYVLSSRGVKPDTIVAIMVERSVAMIIGLLGILKAGGAYLPIDPDYPQERIEYMLSDSNAKVLLATPELQVKAEVEVKENNGQLLGLPLQIVNIEADFVFASEVLPSTLTSTCHISSTNLAYTIYTSGSTGKPKGVLVVHRNVARLVKNTNFIDSTPDERLLLTGAIIFDITTFEIWYPLLNGLILFLVDQEMILDVETLNSFIAANKITILHLIPQLFNQFAAQCLEFFEGLRYFLVGGDLVRPMYINQLRNRYKNLEILHMYGPTENTTFSTFLPVEQDYQITIPIGKPISNSTVYILNKEGKPQPFSVVGELYVGGDGVSRGYLNNPELTYDKFKGPRAKLYKTGDLARWLPDGNIEFLGRIDHQVKLRGFRIEPGEIETRLLNHPDIMDAAAILIGVNERRTNEKSYEDERDDNYLCAYIVANKELTVLDLREFLANKLPDYMIPSEFVQLKKIPLTSTGKVDRKALMALGTKLKIGVEYVAPKSNKEIIIANVWKEMLKLEEVGILDNFFDLGGTSMDIIRINKRLKDIFEKDISIVTMYRYTTIATFSRFLDIGNEEKVGNSRRKERAHKIKKGIIKKQKRREIRTRRKN